MTHVFTYGSLMFDRVWSRVVSGAYRKAPGSLAGFRRHRVIGQDYPALQRVGDDGVDGIIYFNVGPDDLAALDAFEGPEYARIRVSVTVSGEPGGDPVPGSVVDAETYLFIALDRVEPGAWDPEAFERERIEHFLRDYPPPRSA